MTIEDYARADGLSHARAVALALTDAAGGTEASGFELGALEALVSSNPTSFSSALAALGTKIRPRGKGSGKGKRGVGMSSQAGRAQCGKGSGAQGASASGRSGASNLATVGSDSGGAGGAASNTSSKAVTGGVSVADHARNQRQEQRAFRELIAEVSKQRVQSPASSEEGGSYAEYFSSGHLSRAEYLEKDVPCSFGLGEDVFMVESILDAQVKGLGVTEYLVKWVGFKKPTWEVGFTQLQQPHIDKYEASRAKGEVGPVMIFDIDEALPSNTNRSTEMFTMTLTEFVKNMTRAAEEPANCRTLKIAQAGEPPRGYLSHIAGLLVWAAACRRTLQVMSMANFKPPTKPNRPDARPTLGDADDQFGVDHAGGLRHLSAEEDGARICRTARGVPHGQRVWHHPAHPREAEGSKGEGGLGDWEVVFVARHPPQVHRPLPCPQPRGDRHALPARVPAKQLPRTHDEHRHRGRGAA